MIQIYTGEGKGKTTAAMGLALRACGAKKRVAVLQFMKKGDSSEIKTIKKYKLPIDTFAYGLGFYKILGDKHTDAEHKKALGQGLKKANKIIQSEQYDLIILDEINVAINLGLLNIDDVIAMIKTQHQTPTVDIILTGRHAHPELIKIADLVTEMNPIKHYFKKNVAARKGIEF